MMDAKFLINLSSCYLPWFGWNNIIPFGRGGVILLQVEELFSYKWSSYSLTFGRGGVILLHLVGEELFSYKWSSYSLTSGGVILLQVEELVSYIW